MLNPKTMFAAAAVAALLCCAAAGAADFSAPLTQLGGKPFVDADGKAIETTLGSVSETALLASFPDEQNLTGEEKFKRWQIAIKVHAGKKVDLSAEETSLLKRLIAKAFNPLIVGQAWTMLDPAGAK